jgi:putative DNA primase/helicase
MMKNVAQRIAEAPIEVREPKSTLSTSDGAWKEIRALPPALPEAPTMPDSLIPPVLAPWLCDICERTQIPLDFVAAPAIVALSSVVGRTVGIYPKQHDDWLCVPNLWGAVIGRPGVLKSPALAEALKPLRRLAFRAEENHKEVSRAAEAAAVVVQAQIDAAKADTRAAAKAGDQAKLSMAEGDIVQLAEKLESLSVHEKRYIVNDGTVEKLGELLNQNPRGLLLVRDELVGLLRSLEKQGHENDRAFYLESWAGAGAFTYDRIGRGTLHIPALTLSVVGGMTPGKLQSYTNGALAGGIEDDGLLQRFQLMVWPEVTAKWENIDRYPDTAAKNAAAEVYRLLDELAPDTLGAEAHDDQIPGLRFAGDAQELFNEFRETLEHRVRGGDGTAPAFESHMSKYRSLMPSLALIFHLVNVVGGQEQGSVDLQSARLAASWCDYLEHHARKIYATELYPDLTAAHLLASKIRAGAITDEMHVRDIYRPQWSGLTVPEVVWDGFRMLEGCNMVRINREDTGGRQADVIQLHPSLKRTAA